MDRFTEKKALKNKNAMYMAFFRGSGPETAIVTERLLAPGGAGARLGLRERHLHTASVQGLPLHLRGLQRRTLRAEAFDLNGLRLVGMRKDETPNVSEWLRICQQALFWKSPLQIVNVGQQFSLFRLGFLLRYIGFFLLSMSDFGILKGQIYSGSNGKYDQQANGDSNSHGIQLSSFRNSQDNWCQRDQHRNRDHYDTRNICQFHYALQTGTEAVAGTVKMGLRRAVGAAAIGFDPRPAAQTAGLTNLPTISFQAVTLA